MAMNKKRWVDRSLYFLLGILFVIVVVLLTGATNGPQCGRYQISSWTRGKFVGAMIVDTATGRVKYVDENNENKPFEDTRPTHMPSNDHTNQFVLIFTMILDSWQYR